MKRIAILLTILAVALAGCGPKLQAVRDFSTITQTTLSKAGPILSEYNDLCRQAKLKDVPLEYIKDNPEFEKLTDEAKEKKIALAVETSLDEKCRDRSLAVQGFRNMISVLDAYLKALGDLAYDGTVENEAYFNALTAKINNFKDSSGATLFETPENVTAVSNILLTVANGIEQGYRSKQLGKFISEPHLSVERLFDVLILFLNSRLKEEIGAGMGRLEREYVFTRLDALEDVKGCMDDAQCKALYALTLDEYESKRKTSIAQIEQIDALVAALRDSKATFLELYNQRNELNKEHIKIVIDAYYTKIIPNLEKLGVTF
ncbi:MAG: hypothetical protein AB7D39_21065 [Pseudodesulfovibrio sp.]|uniref:hypothetical protein n=1 Tax=Pseudodesulfovibrio sp. TaxID=2035812 RepID=UPI003D0CBE94